MKNTWKKVVGGVLVIALLQGVLAVTPQNAQAASKKDSITKITNAYVKLLKRKYKESDNEFWVGDINHDGVKELIVMEWGHNNGYIYSYYAKKIVQIDCINPAHEYYGFYKRGKVYVRGYMLWGYFENEYIKFKKGKTRRLAMDSDDSESDSKNPKGVIYKIGTKKVSKKQYENYIKKLTKSSKRLSFKYHKVTDKNIKMYCK